jgi:hypothetical protein
MSDKQRATQIGMPWQPKLNYFGHLVWQAFDSCAYLVGSALTRRDYRDVDVRVILDDEDFAQRFERHEMSDKGMIATEHLANPRLAAMNMAFSALGAEITGLPIDFQIDQMTRANAEHPGRRNALGLSFRKFSDG